MERPEFQTFQPETCTPTSSDSPEQQSTSTGTAWQLLSSLVSSWAAMTNTGSLTDDFVFLQLAIAINPPS